MKFPDNIKWKPVGKTLGEGGQAQIHLVTDKESSSNFYALKTLRRDGFGQAYERFYREIEAIKCLNHPNIIKIIDYSKPDDAFHYYVMEYIEGAKTLQKVIDSSDNPFFLMILLKV